MELVWKTRSTKTCVDPLTVLRNLRVKSQTEIDLVVRHIGAAQELIESATNRAIMLQTFVLRIPAILPFVELYRPPFFGDVKLKGVQSTRKGEQAVTHAVSEFSTTLRYMTPTFAFPSVTRQTAGEMVVEYETGTDDPKNVPHSIQQAVILLASHFFANREAVVTDPRKAVGFVLPMGVDSLIRPFRIPNVNISPNEIV